MKSKKRRNEKGNKPYILGVFIIGIMVMSGIGFMIGGDPQNQAELYNGYEVFASDDGRWAVNINGITGLFYNHPAFLEGVSVPDSVIQLLGPSEAFVILMNPLDNNIAQVEFARYEMASLLSEIVGTEVYTAVTDNSTEYKGFVEASCDNSSAELPFVFFDPNSDGITQNGSCVIVGSSDDEVIINTERIIYALSGVMS